MLEAKCIKAIVKYEYYQDVFTYIDLAINAFQSKQKSVAQPRPQFTY